MKFPKPRSISIEEWNRGYPQTYDRGEVDEWLQEHQKEDEATIENYKVGIADLRTVIRSTIESTIEEKDQLKQKIKTIYEKYYHDDAVEEVLSLLEEEA